MQRIKGATACRGTVFIEQISTDSPSLSPVHFDDPDNAMRNVVLEVRDGTPRCLSFTFSPERF